MDLATDYLGLHLQSPLCASASPLNAELEHLRTLEDCGAGAVVLPSVFEEEIAAERDEFERRTVQLSASGSAEAQSYFPAYRQPVLGPQRTLRLIERAKRVLSIPVIASLNCISKGAWQSYARSLEQAGADALELNVYFVPADVTTRGSDVEARYLEILAAVRAAVRVPIAIKLSPYFSAPGAMAQALVDGGADGLVLFNRFYQPRIDIATLRLSLDLELSTPAEMRLPLLWIAVLSGRVRASLAATTGVDSAKHVLEYVLAGADVVMTTSSLLRHGITHMKTLVEGLRELLAARGVTSLAEVRGRLSQRAVPDPTLFERGNYVRILQGYRVPDGIR
ncbi:MAG TPA: dihydroorotate dehydrogenase-like protein [Polyangiaceae bacterium]|nr:dihydroorotate dehydrogenase-like protein [Polyangiaceae bacterium]